MKTDREKLYEALESVIWYDCHYEWLKDLRNELENYGDRLYPIPKEMEWHTEQHCIWMLLVGMFGDWGTSIRSGWIDDFEGCIKFIDKICEESWYWDENR
jgi:hypothetical protein